MKHINFFEAESIALNMAYGQFFGQGQPVGIAYTFINGRKAGNEWSEKDKLFAKQISAEAIRDLKNKNLATIIESGAMHDCAMARRFMATGSGMTKEGYCF